MVLIFGRSFKETGRWIAERSGKYISSFLVLFAILLCVLFLASFVLKYDYNVTVVFIDVEKPLLYVTSPKFLSVALDSVVIANGFKNFNVREPKLLKLLEPLAPGYLRIGGNLADRLIFSPNDGFVFKYDTDIFDGGDCAYSTYYCTSMALPNFTMNGREWLELNTAMSQVGLEIIFDLNVLLRFSNGSWNPSNARQLIDFSHKNGLFLHWELGNEPNAFPHQFNTYMDPQTLGGGFVELRRILNEYPKYKHSLLVGPDITRPQETHQKSLQYLHHFLLEGADVIDAITWHQYYFNGRFAKAFYYINPKIMDILKWQITAINNLSRLSGFNKSIWLGETADAWGGGADDLSNHYISTFIWLDKLGLAAQMGLDVVIRQSIVNGHYALITKNYTPTPNWWVSVLYKTLVGPQVVQSYVASPPEVRLYCHCAKSDDGAIIVFGMNMEETTAKVRIETHEGVLSKRVEAYILSPYLTMFTRKIRLNGVELRLTENNDLPPFVPRILPTKPHIILPAFSMMFLKIPMDIAKSPCKPQ